MRKKNLRTHKQIIYSLHPNRLISSQMQSGAWTENWQQTSRERAGLRYWWIRWSSLLQQAESLYVDKMFLQNPVKGHSLHLISCGSAPITVVLSEKVDEDNSILLHKCRKEKVKHHFMRYCQRPLSLQQEQSPAQIAFNIQTLWNVQFISSRLEICFLEKLLLFF